MLARAGFSEKRVKRIVGLSYGVVGGHLAVGLDAMFEAVELPTSVAHLDPGLADVHAQDLAHC